MGMLMHACRTIYDRPTCTLYNASLNNNNRYAGVVMLFQHLFSIYFLEWIVYRVPSKA